tara:strand:+ start:158 stop:640 length:483 start_codon:yes stop_codon:yes gene_type:complete
MQQSGKSKKMVMGSLGSVFLVIAIIGVVVLFTNRAVSQNWLDTSAIILGGSIIEEEETDDEGYDYITYQTSISYQYEAGGSSHSDTADFSFSSHTNAEKKLDTYPKGTEVTIKVNPNDPSKSRLEQTSGPLAYVLMALGGIGFAIILLVYLTGRGGKTVA